MNTTATTITARDLAIELAQRHGLAERGAEAVLDYEAERMFNRTGMKVYRGEVSADDYDNLVGRDVETGVLTSEAAEKLRSRIGHLAAQDLTGAWKREVSEYFEQIDRVLLAGVRLGREYDELDTLFHFTPGTVKRRMSALPNSWWNDRGRWAAASEKSLARVLEGQLGDHEDMVYRLLIAGYPVETAASALHLQTDYVKSEAADASATGRWKCGGYVFPSSDYYLD